jgi:hypothetical protein
MNQEGAVNGPFDWLPHSGTSQDRFGERIERMERGLAVAGPFCFPTSKASAPPAVFDNLDDLIGDFSQLLLNLCLFTPNRLPPFRSNL